jgi:ABC-type histidine transport system ATPase subunit
MNRLQKTALEGKSLSGKEMDRLMFLKARLVQLDQLAELMGATHHEVHRMEDRMAIILDALNLDGHTGILEERMYLPSPLLAELQSITWGTEKVTSEV